MSRRAPLLVISLVVMLLISTAGCIEVKEKPPQGPFTIELVSQVMYFVPETGGQLDGPHATVDTEIAHAHEGYEWDIEGLGEFEGAEVELPANDVGVREASYHVHFIDQENHTAVSVATVPDLSKTYFVIGDGIGLEHGDEDDQTLNLEMTWGNNLTEVASGDGGTIQEYAGHLSDDPILVKLVHNNSNEGTVTYLVGVHAQSGELLEEDMGSIRMMPGECHYLSYIDGGLWVTIYKDSPHDIFEESYYNGTFEDLPSEYRTHIGRLEWEGHVGEVEESPGFGALISMAAVATMAVLLLASRRR
jgi:hypothetical protein